MSRIVKQGHIQNPPPARVFVFADVHEAAVDSGDFSFNRNDRTLWEHKPTDRHNQGANHSFADGHVEYRRWKWPKPFTRFDEPAANPFDQADLDYLWSSLPEGFPN